MPFLCTLKKKKKPHSNQHKLTHDDVRKLRGMAVVGFSYKDIAEVFNVHPTTVSRIVSKQYYKDVK